MKMIFFVFLMLSSSTVFAWHTSSGKVNKINVYSATDAVLVTLVNAQGEVVNGAAVDECSNTSTFAISPSLPEERRSQMLSILLMAKATGRNISLSYNTNGGCVPYGNNSKAYRGIVRVIF